MNHVERRSAGEVAVNSAARTVVGSLLPDGVACVEFFCDPPGIRLFASEEAALAAAVDKRRREYATVRHCARLALADLGLPPVPILNGPDREPLWPPGIVGSMTHCDGYRAAALALAGTLASIGIDAEPHAPLPPGVLHLVARPDEVAHLARLAAEVPEVHWDRLLFSAKESIYKAWFPLARRWLGFDDATLNFDPASRVFTAVLHRAGPRVCGRALTTMAGRWLVHNGLILTAVTVAQPSGEAEPEPARSSADGSTDRGTDDA